MAKNPTRFGDLLKKAIDVISANERKSKAVVKDELGYALGRDTGGSSIEYWMKGHVPASVEEVLKLTTLLVQRGGLDYADTRAFLESAGLGTQEAMIKDLFSTSPKKLPEEKPFPQALNTFVIGPPVTHPKHFFGRTRELKRIFSRWQRFPLEHFAVMGKRRAGKTSLLYYVKNITQTAFAELRSGQRNDWLPHPEHFKWVLADFQDARMCHQDHLIRYLLINLHLPIPAACTLENFMEVIVSDLQTPAVILMDEIEAALKSPELDKLFWDSLRSLISNEKCPIAFLVSALESPIKLAQDHGKTSPFFNCFQTIELGPLTEDEALELITISPKPFSPPEVEWILTQSAGWPLLLQILCQTRLEAFDEDQEEDAWKQEGLKRIDPYRYLIE